MSIRTRASVLCIHEKQLLVVRLQDPQTKRIYLLPPGGKIEPGERPAAAALREAKEETGFDVELDEESETVIRYPFEWAGRTHDCTTHFFLARLLSAESAPIEDEEINLGAAWLPLRDLPKELAYHETLRTAIIELVERAPA
jgi:8-oxo-dGTP pyrophosphatase MutT (NUDIX family)